MRHGVGEKFSAQVGTDKNFTGISSGLEVLVCVVGGTCGANGGSRINLNTSIESARAGE